MATADEYRECAVHCSRLAEVEPSARARWLAQAERWTAMAAKAEAWKPFLRRSPSAPQVSAPMPNDAESGMIDGGNEVMQR
jgi:hypothetical protein